jgi:hypothetical protein
MDDQPSDEPTGRAREGTRELASLLPNSGARSPDVEAWPAKARTTTGHPRCLQRTGPKITRSGSAASKSPVTFLRTDEEFYTSAAW